MAKITIDSNTLKTYPGNEHLVRIANDVNEPPKNYIWCKPDDCCYIWKGTKWIPIDSWVMNYDDLKPTMDKLITEADLNEKVRILKAEIIRQLNRMLELKGYSGGGSGIDDTSLFIRYNTIVNPEDIIF